MEPWLGLTARRSLTVGEDSRKHCIPIKGYHNTAQYAINVSISDTPFVFRVAADSC